MDKLPSGSATFLFTDIENSTPLWEKYPEAMKSAASRITVFSPEQIAKRLDDRFKLLTGGSRTALPRQQTLRALAGALSAASFMELYVNKEPK